jgi:VWFA-related protein
VKRQITVLLLALGFVGALRAQETFTDMIAVTEVEVPVRVLIKGEPVAGLTRADFEIFDRGDPREIIGFRVHDLWGSKGVQPSPGVGIESEGQTGRRLLILIDFSFSRRQRLAQALRGIRTSLEQKLDPSDRIAVATYGAVSGLNLLVGFTADRDKTRLALDAVQAMLDAKRKRQREFLAQLHEARFASRDQLAGSSTFDVLREELGATAALAVLSGPVVYSEAEDDGVIIEAQRSIFAPIKVRVEVDVIEPIDIAQDLVVDPDVSAIRALGLSLTELTLLLRDVGGQKDMLFYSEGFGGPLLENARSLFYLQKAFRAFRDSGWTLHSVDVGGIPGIYDQSFASNSLLFMADATGGDLVENFNDFSLATSKVLQRTGIVYMLSFQPDAPGDDGQFHPLEVKLKDPPKGVQIIHRPGYYAQRSPADREVFEQRIDAAEWLLTNLEASELEVAVYAETITDPLGGTRVPVAVELAGSSLMAIRTSKPSQLELQLVALDPEMKVWDVLTAETRLDYSSKEVAVHQGGVRFLGELGIPPGEYQIRVLVRSRRRGEVFLGTYPLAVGGFDEVGLPPPPATEERLASQWVTVQAQRRSAYFR